jgi:hypothetical protein
MSEFETELISAVQRVVLKKVASGDWLGLPVASWNGINSNRLEVSRDFLAGLYKRIDLDHVSTLVLHRIEERIADKIFNQLAVELGSDTKAVMCDGKARELFRESIRERLASVCHPKSGE